MTIHEMRPADTVEVMDIWLLWVAFSRWPIERCFEVGKRELGMDHFEVRSWQAIHRHFYISQLSQLFSAKICSAVTRLSSMTYLSKK